MKSVLSILLLGICLVQVYPVPQDEGAGEPPPESDAALPPAESEAAPPPAESEAEPPPAESGKSAPASSNAPVKRGPGGMKMNGPAVTRPFTADMFLPHINSPYADNIEECEKLCKTDEEIWCGINRKDRSKQDFHTPCHWECNREHYDLVKDSPC